MLFNQLSTAQISIGGPPDPRTYIKDPTKRPSAMEFIRTVRIGDHNQSWTFGRVDIDVPEANFTRYKEILFSFNGGFRPSAGLALNLYPRRQGALYDTSCFYNSWAVTAATPTTAWVSTGPANVIPIAPVTTGIIAGTNVRQCDVYMSQFGFRSEVVPGNSGAVGGTGGPVKTIGHYTNSTDGTPAYLETDFPGVTIYFGNGTTQTMNTPTGITGGGCFECNIYGFIR